MIEFTRIAPEHKARYDEILRSVPERGCEYSFGNLCMWGKQNLAFLHGCVAFFSHFHGRSVYPFPIGSGDKKAVLEEIIHDAGQRGLPCRITGMTDADRAYLEETFPGRFVYRSDRGSCDYVYDIHDLADLRGRKYQKKRNHFNRFQATHPGYQVVPITPDTVPAATEMVEHWYEKRLEIDPDGDYLLEKLALKRAWRCFETLGLEGCMIVDDGQVLAVTVGSRMTDSTFDIHFEKAREDVDGAYAAINCEFARYLRLKYPEARFLNREEDMGLEGLRKAKLSYLPHHMVPKHWAYLAEDIHED